MSAPKALDPPTVIRARAAAAAGKPPMLTADQVQLQAAIETVQKEERFHLSLVGAAGLGLLFTAGYLLWRRR